MNQPTNKPLITRQGIKEIIQSRMTGISVDEIDIEYSSGRLLIKDVNEIASLIESALASQTEKLNKAVELLKEVMGRYLDGDKLIVEDYNKINSFLKENQL